MSLQDATFDFAYNAHQCPTCGKEVLTLEQLDDYNASCLIDGGQRQQTEGTPRR